MTQGTAPQHWATWSDARGYPLAHDEEHDLITEFRHFKGDKPKRNPKVLTDHHVASLLLTMLRDGATAETVEALTPNLDPRDLADIYDNIQARIDATTHAWHQLTSDPVRYADQADEAALIMPHLVNILRSPDQEDLTDLVHRMSVKSHKATAKINDLEQSMHDATSTAARQTMHYSLVKADSCLWDDALFLPSRVGQLTPTRLSFLLEDHR